MKTSLRKTAKRILLVAAITGLLTAASATVAYAETFYIGPGEGGGKSIKVTLNMKLTRCAENAGTPINLTLNLEM